MKGIGFYHLVAQAKHRGIYGWQEDLYLFISTSNFSLHWWFSWECVEQAAFQVVVDGKGRLSLTSGQSHLRFRSLLWGGYYYYLFIYWYAVLGNVVISFFYTYQSNFPNTTYWRSCLFSFMYSCHLSYQNQIKTLPKKQTRGQYLWWI